MDVKPEHLLPDSGAWGIIGSLTTIALAGAVWLAKAIFKSKNARRMLAAGLNPEDNKESNTETKDNQTVINALLAFLKSMETDRQADRQERGRQWERIEQIVTVCRDQAEETRNVIAQVETMGAQFQQALLQLSKEVSEVKDNQIRLSEYLRQGSQFPQHRQRPHG